jgi:hypothetical protein
MGYVIRTINESAIADLSAATPVVADVSHGYPCRRSPDVSYLHVHNARPGCFNFRVERTA